MDKAVVIERICDIMEFTNPSTHPYDFIWDAGGRGGGRGERSPYNWPGMQDPYMSRYLPINFNRLIISFNMLIDGCSEGLYFNVSTQQYGLLTSK